MLVTTQKYNRVINLTEISLIELSVKKYARLDQTFRFKVSVSLIDGTIRTLGSYSSHQMAENVMNALADGIDDELPFYVMPQDREEGDDDAADQSE